MLDSLKQAGKNIGRGLCQTWESLSEGWRELFSSSSDALTHFSRNKLPRNVDADNAEASYRNGVLSIRLPKSDADNSRNVRVI